MPARCRPLQSADASCLPIPHLQTPTRCVCLLQHGSTSLCRSCFPPSSKSGCGRRRGLHRRRRHHPPPAARAALGTTYSGPPVPATAACMWRWGAPPAGTLCAPPSPTTYCPTPGCLPRSADQRPLTTIASPLPQCSLPIPTDMTRFGAPAFHGRLSNRLTLAISATLMLISAPHTSRAYQRGRMGGSAGALPPPSSRAAAACASAASSLGPLLLLLPPAAASSSSTRPSSSPTQRGVGAEASRECFVRVTAYRLLMARLS